MNIEDKEEFVAGSSSARFRANLSEDAALQDELKVQVEMNRMLGALLDESSNADVSRSVMEQIRKQRREGRTPPIAFPLWRTAALLVIGILPGFLIGRYQPEDDVDRSQKEVSITMSPGTGSSNSDRLPPAPSEDTTGKIFAILGELDGLPFADALAHLETSLRGTEKERAIEMLLSRRAQNEPEQVLSAVLGGQRPYSSLALERTSKLFAAWSRIDLDAALAAAQNLPGSAKKMAMQEILNWLSASDPARFVQLAPEGNQLMSSNWQSAFKKLHAEDEVRAFELLETLDGENRNAALSGIAEGLAATNPSEALTWAEGAHRSSDSINRPGIGHRNHRPNRPASGWERYPSAPRTISRC